MTTYIRTRKEQKLELNGDLLTGDTYPIKDYIKTTLGGKWIADRKAWKVDVVLVEKWLDKGTIYTDKNPETRKDTNGSAASNGWCNHCHSYCWGDCQS